MNRRRRTAFLDEAAPHPLRRDEEGVDTRIEPHAVHAVVRKNRGEKEIFLAALLEARRRTLRKRMRADHRVRCMTAHKTAHVALRQGSDELLHGRSALPVPREAIEQLVKVRHEVQHLQVDRLHEPSDPRRIALREVDDRHMRLRLRPQESRCQGFRCLHMSRADRRRYDQIAASRHDRPSLTLENEIIKQFSFAMPSILAQARSRYNETDVRCCLPPQAVRPPSTLHAAPVTKEAASEARKKIISATSSARAIRPSG